MAKKREKGEGNIRKRKDGRWEGRWEGRYTAGMKKEAAQAQLRKERMQELISRSRDWSRRDQYFLP